MAFSPALTFKIFMVLGNCKPVYLHIYFIMKLSICISISIFLIITSVANSFMKSSLKSNQLFRNNHVHKSSLIDKIEITKDGSIFKEIITRGNGKMVETGDILAVEYSASIAGSNTPFAKGEQEKFVFKDGTMIKGWDIGVGSMKIGEKSKIYLQSKYGYGEAGIAPVIPANSDLVLDVKILAWLGNQLSPESLFQKDLDIDPFIASTPEAIQAEFDTKQVSYILNRTFKIKFYL